MSDTGEVFNPEYNPNGAEGSLDTNKLPWIPLDNVKGLSINFLFIFLTMTILAYLQSPCILRVPKSIS